MGRRPGQTGWTLDIEPISLLQAWELLLERSWTRLTCLSIPRPGLCNPSLFLGKKITCLHFSTVVETSPAVGPITEIVCARQ